MWPLRRKFILCRPPHPASYCQARKTGKRVLFPLLFCVYWNWTGAEALRPCPGPASPFCQRVDLCTRSLQITDREGGRDGTELIFLQHESISTLPNPHATKLTKSNHVLHLKKIAKCITYQRHSMYYSNMTDGFFLGRKQCCPSFPRKSCPQPIKWLPHSSQRPRPGRLLFGWLEFLSLTASFNLS